jgi:hypothetical protein
LFHQMTRISAEKGSLMHDDKLDALAIAVEALAGTMSRNAYQEARSRSDEDDDPVAKSWLNQGASISPLFSFL